MERSFVSDAEYGLGSESPPLNEHEHLLGSVQNVNIRMRRLIFTEVDESQLPPEHMFPTARNEDEAGSEQCFSSGMSHSERSVTSVHCHGPVSPTDPVARNQLIAISVLCFVFMVAEVVGEF